MGASWGRWLDEVLLEPLPEPDPGQVVAPGGIVLAVHSAPAAGEFRWYTAVALAWARDPDGAWGVLLAWEAMFRPAGGEDRVGGRRGWFLFDPERCSALTPTPVPNAWGLAWFGRREDSPMARAVAAAVEGLPEHLRARAAVPVAKDGVMRPPSG